MVIALAGKKIAGKGTAADFLEKEYGAHKVRFSAILQDILERLHKDYTRGNLVKLGTALRELYGDDVLAQVLKSDIEKGTHEHTVIDGMRYQEEYNILRQLPDFKLVYVSTTIENRYERMQARGEKLDEAAMTFEEFNKRETDATEIQIEQLKSKADIVITNNEGFEEYYEHLRQVMQ